MNPQQEALLNDVHEGMTELRTLITEAVVPRIDNMEKTVYGNGKPGLKVDNELVKESIRNLEKLHGECRQARKDVATRKPAIFSNLIAAGALIVATVAIFVGN